MKSPDIFEQDQLYMKRALELAMKYRFKTKSNPCVGAVIVHQGKVIGEGAHEYFGGPHAEVNAVNSVNINDLQHLPASTIYVTLEPCCTTGKTPPCLDLILNKKIGRVVVSVTDPNSDVDGKSIKVLKEKAVPVITGIMQQEGQDLIKPFQANLSSRPYVVLKFAQSTDAYIGKRGKQVWLSNQKSKVLVHKWRSELDGILVGYATAATDNPSLTTRLVRGHNPTRFVLDRDRSLDNNLNLFDNEADTYRIVSQNPVIDNEIYGNLTDIEALLKTIYSLGIHSILIEGGAKTIRAFIDSELWDEARIITAPIQLISGIRAPFVRGRLYLREYLDQDRIDYVFRE